jgi:DNA-binding transcriptional LysR family regulator
MSLTETKVIDQITVTENGTIMYREATRILRNGDQIAQTFERTCLRPGQDLTGQPEQVVSVANASWTPAVIAAFQAQQEANRLGQ